jgi:hypothetical protein
VGNLRGISIIHININIIISISIIEKERGKEIEWTRKIKRIREMNIGAAVVSLEGGEGNEKGKKRERGSSMVGGNVTVVNVTEKEMQQGIQMSRGSEKGSTVKVGPNRGRALIGSVVAAMAIPTTTTTRAVPTIQAMAMLYLSLISLLIGIQELGPQTAVTIAEPAVGLSMVIENCGLNLGGTESGREITEGNVWSVWNVPNVENLRESTGEGIKGVGKEVEKIEIGSVIGIGNERELGTVEKVEGGTGNIMTPIMTLEWVTTTMKVGMVVING